MKQLVFIYLTLFISYLSAQDVKAYGIVSYKKSPVSKVQIALYLGDSLVRKTYSDKKGRFHVTLSERKSYTLYFYKPSYNIYSYRITNKLDQEFQNVLMDVPLTYTNDVRDSVFNKSPVVGSMNTETRQSYRRVIGEYLNEKKTRTTAISTFSDYSAEFDRAENGILVHVFQTKIGPDTYEKLVDSKGQARFKKNEKPITDVTYDFETKRREDIVLKKERKVKHHSQFKPLQKK